MTKTTLITKSTDYTTFGISSYLYPHINDYFTLVEYDPAQTYSTVDCAVLVTYASITRDQWYLPLVESGFKLIVDHLQDSDVDRTSTVDNGVLTLRNPNWMWYWTSMEYHHHGYHQYTPNRQYTHAFLMLMNRPEWHRDQLIESLDSVLDQALYSYVGRGIKLESDQWHTGMHQAPRWLSYTNTDWYDSTCFSVVAESYMRSYRWQDSQYSYKTEISEKVLKPLAFEHPFVVFGSVDSLAYLKSQGFETFDNLFDESYDTVVDDRDRHSAATNSVLAAVDLYKTGNLHIDQLTLEKLAHNRARFFDQAVVSQRFRDEVITDMLNFINS
jgi:hypothetical protein